MHLPTGSATIVAFDGIVADTFPLRTYALADAITSECVPVAAHELLPHLAGRSLREAAIEAMQQLPTLREYAEDITLHDIIALRAQRSWSAAAAQGIPLHDGVLPALLREVARGTRVVLRADSQRREVESLLRLSGIEDMLWLVRCSDDAPRVMGTTTLESSYHAILDRLRRQHIDSSRCTAVEVAGITQQVAARFVAVPSGVFPGASEFS